MSATKSTKSTAGDPPCEIKTAVARRDRENKAVGKVWAVREDKTPALPWWKANLGVLIQKRRMK